VDAAKRHVNSYESHTKYDSMNGKKKCTMMTSSVMCMWNQDDRSSKPVSMEIRLEEHPILVLPSDVVSA